MPRTRAEREDAKWDKCRRCGHYRVEHGPTERRCLAVTPSMVDPSINDRCTCTGMVP